MASSSSSDWCNRLSDDIIFEILLELPVSSLDQCKLVCKSWLSIIKNPDFISQHRDRLPKSKDTNLIVNHGRVDNTIRFTTISTDNICFSKSFTPSNGDQMKYEGSIASSFHGIVCVTYPKLDDKEDREVNVVSLWNPATTESVVLPPPPSPRSSICEGDTCTEINYGFGYDGPRKDYKLVRILIEDIEDFEHREGDEPTSQVDVYSLREDSWKVLNTHVPNFSVTCNPRKPFMKENYCWLGYHQSSKEYSVLLFSFSQEKFTVIPGPEFDDDDNSCGPVLSFLSDKMSLIDWNEDYNIKIWVHNGNGVEKLWTKQYTLKINQLGKPLGFSMNDKLILLRGVKSRRFYLYDLGTQEINTVRTNKMIEEIAQFQESLIAVARVKKRPLYKNVKSGIASMPLPTQRHCLVQTVLPIQQSESSIVRVQGPGLRKVSALPTSVYGDFQGQLKLDTDKLSDLVSVMEILVSHSQTDVSQEHQQQTQSNNTGPAK